jgi:hypothetical protein
VVEDNLDAARMWAASGAAARRRLPVLNADFPFEVTRPLQQPLTPGPITITDRTARTRVFAPRRFCAARAR